MTAGYRRPRGGMLEYVTVPSAEMVWKMRVWGVRPLAGTP
jgi:hypothetical protein